MDVDRPEPGGAPRVVVVELEHVRGARSVVLVASVVLAPLYSRLWSCVAASRFSAGVLAGYQADQHPPCLQRGRLAGTRTHADRNGRATRVRPCAPRRPRSPPAATVHPCRADDIAPKRRWSTTFARLDHIPARASGNDAVQNEYSGAVTGETQTRTHLMRLERQRYLSTRCFANETKHHISSIRQHSSGDYDRSGTRGVCSQPARLSSGRF